MNEETTVFDIWRAVLRHRKLILSIWGMVVLGVVIYLLTTPPLYESRSVLRVGRTAGEPVMSIRTLVLALKDDYGVGNRDRQYPLLASVKQEGDDAIVLTAEAPSGDEAQRFLTQVIEKVVDEQSQSHRVLRERMERELAALDGRIGTIENDIKRLQSAASGRTDMVTTAMLTMQGSTLQTTLVSLLEVRIKLQRDMFSLNTYPTYALRQPRTPDEPSKPRIKLVLVLAIVVGAILGLVAALAANLTSKMRNVRQA